MHEYAIAATTRIEETLNCSRDHQLQLRVNKKLFSTENNSAPKYFLILLFYVDKECKERGLSDEGRLQ